MLGQNITFYLFFILHKYLVWNMNGLQSRVKLSNIKTFQLAINVSFLAAGAAGSVVAGVIIKLCKLSSRFVAGGRYKIYREERKGFVDTSLIIEDISLKDHMSRWITSGILSHFSCFHLVTTCRYKCSGSNSLGSAEKTVTIQVYGKFLLQSR